MEKSNSPIPIANGVTFAIPGSELIRAARDRGDVAVEVSPYSNSLEVTSTVVIDAVAEHIHAAKSGGNGWTSIVIETKANQWLNLVVSNVDALIEALKNARDSQTA